VTQEEWLTLRRGDIIIEVKTGVERRVLSVSRKKNWNARKIRTSITLKKLVKTYWTPGDTTTYSNYDDRGRWKLKKA
jgi:hypothetical protein